MRRVLERYVFREVAAIFFIAMIVMVTLMLIQSMIQVTEWVVNRGVPIFYVLKMVLLMLPFFLIIVMPVALLLATLLAVNRLSSDSEITAMKAAGFSVARLFGPVVSLGALCTVITVLLSLYAIPTAAEWTEKMKVDLVRISARAGIQVKRFIKMGSGLTVYVDAVENDKLKGVMLAQIDNKNMQTEGPNITMVFAKEGRITPDPELFVNYLHLTDGEIQVSEWDEEIFRSIKFDTFDIKIEVEQERKGKKLERGSYIELMSLAKLKRKEVEYAARLRDAQSTAPRSKTARTAVERYRVALRQIDISRHQKFSLPFACLILALWGIPLGIQPPRTTRHQGVVTSIFLTLVYYFLVSGGKIMAVKGLIAPIWALWGPNIIVVLSGLTFLYRAVNDRPLPLATAAARVAEWAARLAERYSKR